MLTIIPESKEILDQDSVLHLIFLFPHVLYPYSAWKWPLLSSGKAVT